MLTCYGLQCSSWLYSALGLLYFSRDYSETETIGEKEPSLHAQIQKKSTILPSGFGLFEINYRLKMPYTHGNEKSLRFVIVADLYIFLH